MSSHNKTQLHLVCEHANVPLWVVCLLYCTGCSAKDDAVHDETSATSYKRSRRQAQLCMPGIIASQRSYCYNSAASKQDFIVPPPNLTAVEVIGDMRESRRGGGQRLTS